MLAHIFILHNPSIAQSNLDNQETELCDIVQALFVLAFQRVVRLELF